MRRNIINALCDQHIFLNSPTGTSLCLYDLAEELLDEIAGDFIDIILFETGTCCIIIQSDWNQNKIIVGIRMLYPNKN